MLFGLSNVKIIGDEKDLIIFDDQVGKGLRCKNVILDNIAINFTSPCVDMGVSDYPILEPQLCTTSLKMVTYDSEVIGKLPDREDEKSIQELLKLIKTKLDGRKK